MAYDSYYSQTALILHCDGVNGAVTFPDTSLGAKTITVVGNAQVSTASNKWGGASALFDGSGDALRCNHADFAFGTLDFTIEFWINPTAGGHGASYSRILETQAYGTTGGITISTVGTESPTHINVQGSQSGLESPIVSTSTVPNGSWSHVAVCRSAGTLMLYINGTMEASTSYAYNFTKQALSIGSNNGGTESYNGYLDDIRITKMARYLTNFSVPTEAFPDAAYPDNLATRFAMAGSPGTPAFGGPRLVNGHVPIHHLNL